MLNCLFAPTPLSLVVWSVLPWLAIVAFLGLPSSLSSEPDQSNATRRAYIRAGFILSVLYMGIAFTFKTKASLSWTGKTLRNICFVLLVFIGIIWAPDTVYSYLLVPYVEITAALWLLIQSVILVDCVHAVHLFILTMAHNTHKSQGLRFALIYYIFHLSLGATSFFCCMNSEVLLVAVLALLPQLTMKVIWRHHIILSCRFVSCFSRLCVLSVYFLV